MRQLATKIGLGLVLTCGVSALALAQAPKVDTSKLDTDKAKAERAKSHPQQAKDSADEGDVGSVDAAATSVNPPGAVKKKAKSAKTSGKKSADKPKDAAKDLPGK